MEESGLDTATAQGAAVEGSGSATEPQAAEQSASDAVAYGVTIDSCRVTEDYQEIRLPW